MVAQGQQRGPGEAVDQAASEAGQAAAEAQERPRTELGDPAADPPMTVRIEPGRHWRDREARRAIRVATSSTSHWHDRCCGSRARAQQRLRRDRSRVLRPSLTAHGQGRLDPSERMSIEGNDMTGRHEIVEIMASSWDEAGHRPPRNWRCICSCGWTERELKTRVAASAAWRAHVDSARAD
jgi:hypothetical protein